MVTSKHGLGVRSLKVIGTNYTYRSATYDFLLTFHSNHGPMPMAVSEINVDFSQKSQNFPTPMYLCPQLMGFILEFGARNQKLE